MSKVTAITSVYNGEKYIKAFLKSAKKQTYDSFEIQMELNNPSFKESSMVKKFQNKNNFLKFITQKKVNTMSKSWNNCINSSTGEYICIWNIDDIRTNYSIEEMAHYLDSNKEKDIVFGDYHLVKSYKSKRGKLIDNSDKLDRLKTGMFIGPFFMFRKSLILKCGMFDEQLKTGADFDFAMRIIKNGNTGYIKKNLGYFLDEKKGSSTKPDTLQPLERTVVELRYNLPVSDRNLINKAKKLYDINNLYFQNKKVKVSNYYDTNS